MDVDFDVLELTNTLTQEKHILEAITSMSVGRLYYQALVDFTGLEVGEYEYSAKLSDKVVQTGLSNLLMSLKNQYRLLYLQTYPGE